MNFYRNTANNVSHSEHCKITITNPKKAENLPNNHENQM